MATFMSWNMHQRDDAWARAAELMTINAGTAAMLQEARQPSTPPAGFSVVPESDDPDRWRLSVPPTYRADDGSLRPVRRPFVSALMAPASAQLTERRSSALHESVDGEFACSHPGQFAVGELSFDSGERITLVSLYGIWDRMKDSRRAYPEATLHRAISDLTLLFQERANEFVLIAGDLNVYSYATGDRWVDRGLTVFSRLAAYGIEWCGPFRGDDEARLDGCPCPDLECRHVHTYLHQSNPANRPHQIDYILASAALRERLIGSWADPDPEWYLHSDHRPVFASFDL